MADVEKGVVDRDPIAADAPEVHHPDAAANAPEVAPANDPQMKPADAGAPELPEGSSSLHKDGLDENEKIAAIEAEDGVAPPRLHGLVAPELIRNMTPEYRAELEQRLVRKIDLRLMPAIIVMYILNYIDR